MKQYAQGHVIGVVRRIVQGTESQVNQLVQTSQGDGVINTAYIERLAKRATFRARLAGFVRRGRNLVQQTKTLQVGVYLVGAVYNFCTYHESLRVPLYVGRTARKHWVPRTPQRSLRLPIIFGRYLNYSITMRHSHDGVRPSIAEDLPTRLENLLNNGVVNTHD